MHASVMTSTAWQCCSETALQSKQSTLIDQNAKTCCRMIVHTAPPNAADFMPRCFTPPSVPASCLPVSCPAWRLHLQPQLAESPPVQQLAEAQLSPSWPAPQLLDWECPACAAVRLPERLLCDWLKGGPAQEGGHQQGTDWLPSVRVQRVERGSWVQCPVKEIIIIVQRLWAILLRCLLPLQRRWL